MLASVSRGQELFLDLLTAIAAVLRYHFDKTDLDMLSYAPQGWEDNEMAQLEIRNLFVRLLKGESFL